MSAPKLKVAWATHIATKYACENWHYAKRVPRNKLVKIGAWENGKFIGVVVFGFSVSSHLHEQFGLDRFNVCELVRVALSTHHTPVSRIVSISLKFLRRSNPGLRLAVSFADPMQGHHGGIYQAGNWVYTGKSSSQVEYRVRGKWIHARVAARLFTASQVRALPKRSTPGKYRYVMPFDDETRVRVEGMRKPYPKREAS